MNDELFPNLPRYRTRLEMWKQKYTAHLLHSAAVYPNPWMAWDSMLPFKGYGNTEAEALEDFAVRNGLPWLEEFPAPELIMKTTQQPAK